MQHPCSIRRFEAGGEAGARTLTDKETGACSGSGRKGLGAGSCHEDTGSRLYTEAAGEGARPAEGLRGDGAPRAPPRAHRPAAGGPRRARSRAQDGRRRRVHAGVCRPRTRRRGRRRLPLPSRGAWRTVRGLPGSADAPKAGRKAGGQAQGPRPPSPVRPGLGRCPGRRGEPQKGSASVQPGPLHSTLYCATRMKFLKPTSERCGDAETSTGGAARRNRTWQGLWAYRGADWFCRY